VKNEIICGDALKVLWVVPEESARLVVADPPYFRVLNQQWDNQWRDEEAYLEWSARWMVAAMRVLMPGGLLYCFGQVGKREHAFLHLASQASCGWTFHDLIIWDRCVGYNERRDSFTPCYEMILVLRKDGAPAYFDKSAVREPYDAATVRRYARDRRYKNRAARAEHLRRSKYATNLWRIPSLKGSSRERVGHPSQKPQKLMERIVLSCSRAGELVVDPFLGSGTTAVVCQKHRRDWLGIEVSSDYCDMARQRLKEVSARADTLTETAGEAA